MSLCLLASLVACKSAPERPQVTKLVPIPAELVQPIPEPQLSGETNGALVSLIEALRTALHLANDRLRSIGAIGK